jgi:energy-coupling factor transporter ATP-binding protein EcfA2
MTLSIKVTPKDGGTYKSISSIVWSDIPPFSILTGRNGSGKTQLLEIIAHSLSRTVPQEYGNTRELPVTVSIEGLDITPADVSFVPDTGRFSGGAPVTLAQMSQLTQQLRAQNQNISNMRHDVNGTARYHKLIRRLGGKAPHMLNDEEFRALLPDDFEYMIDDVDVTTGLGHVFLAYRIESLTRIEKKERGEPQDEAPQGPAPWAVVNDALRVADFPYELISPLETTLLQPYQITFKDKTSGATVKAADLSSGEKVLLQLVLWLYSSNNTKGFPKLLLLDEPDAHLHPSMTRQFLDVISEVLVGKYGVTVIITTHSPSTVALAPDGATFQMERGNTVISQVSSKPDIINVLTSGLLIVSENSRYVFVEDSDDVYFYEAVRDILTDYGPSKDPRCVKPSPTIVFIPVSVGVGAARIPGGSSIVRKWVEKLDSAPLNWMFCGLIDRDASNTRAGVIRVTGRYSIENYLLDPLNIYCLLLEAGLSPLIGGVTISQGDAHLLRTLPVDALQSITDRVAAMMEAADSGLRTGRTVKVHYTVDRAVDVPDWVIERRGHDLLPIAQRAFGSLVNPPGLGRALRRCRLVPVDLAELIADLQVV